MNQSTSISPDRFHANGDGTAWWIPPDGPEPSNDWPGWDEWEPDVGPFWKLLDRPCDTCGGRRWSLGDHTPGLYDAVPCKRCIDGRHTFTIEVECDRCLPDARGYEMTGGAEWKLPDGRWVRACYECGDPERWASPGSGFREHRVSVVPGTVLPIVRYSLMADRDKPFIVKLSAPKMSGHNYCIVRPDTKPGKAELIRLPSGAGPGMWAVLLKVAT